MRQYIGIDLHKQTSYVTRMNERGKILEQLNLSNDPDTLRGYLTRQRSDTRFAVEATGNWMYLYELIEDRCPDLVLAHPQKTKAIASARIKTDKIDSTILAHLLRTNLLPTAYIPPREVRDTREVLRYRAALVSLRTSIKNRMSAILSKTGVKTPTKKAFGVKSRRFLAEVTVRSCYRLELDGYLRLLEHLTEEILQVTQRIETQVKEDPQATLLCTMPGIGAYSALLILSEIGDISRFPDSRHLCSYAGLIPSVHASGGKTRLGRLTKQGLEVVALDTGRAVGPRNQWRAPISQPLLPDIQKAWSQYRSGRGGSCYAQGHLCDAEEAGIVSTDCKRKRRPAPWGHGHCLKAERP